MEIELFLGEIYDFSAGNRINDGIDVVIGKFEYWLERGDWWLCKQVMTRVNPLQLHPAISLSILSMTLVIKNYLGISRLNFLRDTKQLLIDRYGVEEADYNLSGLA